MAKKFYGDIPQERIDRVRKAVKEYNNKLLYAKKYKGVSKVVIPEYANADQIIHAYGDKPKQLDAKLRQLKKFTTRGKVYKTKGGVRTTEFMYKDKMKNVKRAKKFEEEKLQKARNLDISIRDYHEHRINRLSKIDEFSTVQDLRVANTAIQAPEVVAMRKKQAVENFKKSIAYAYSEASEDLDALNPHFNETLTRRLERLSDDEILDMLENDSTVRSIMEYYREADDPNLKHYGKSYFDLLWELQEEMPNKIKHYYRLRQQK